MLVFLALVVPPAHAACNVSGLAPASGTTATSLPTFSFLISADCASAQLVVEGFAGARTPIFGGTVGPLRRMVFTPSAVDWGRWSAPGRAVVRWRAAGTDSSGATTFRTAVLDLDLDADGYTRTAGDTAACDADSTIHPGADELANGLDDDCDGLGEYTGDVTWATAGDLCDAYDVIDGDLLVSGADATDLGTLSCLQLVTGDVAIRKNTILSSLDGLEQLRAVGGDLTIGDGSRPEMNPALEDLHGLSGLESVGGSLTIDDELVDCTGLEALTTVGGTLSLGSDEYGWSGPASFVGLDALTSTGGLVLYGNGATDMTGLGALTTIAGSLAVYSSGLASFEGLDSLTDLSGSLALMENPALRDFTGLEHLTRIGGSLALGTSNTEIESFRGLNAVESIGTLSFGATSDPRGSGLDSCTVDNGFVDFEGLESLRTIVYDLKMLCADGPTTFVFPSLETIGRDLTLMWLDGTESMAGFDSLRSVGDDLTLGSDDCDRYGGSCGVYGVPAPSLDGLESLESVGGEMLLYGVNDTSALTKLATVGGALTVYGGASPSGSVSGLTALTSIGGNFSILSGNWASIGEFTSLTTIDGYLDIGLLGYVSEVGDFPVLTEVAGVYFVTVPALEVLPDFPMLTDDNGPLKLTTLTSLRDISGLSALRTVASSFNVGSTGLTTLDGLDNLTTVGTSMTISGNTSLTDISALAAVESIGSALAIKNNTSLPTADAEAFAAGVVSIGGTVTISGNAP